MAFPQPKAVTPIPIEEFDLPNFLWEHPISDWLSYSLTAEEFAHIERIPKDLRKEIYKDIYDFGPNGDNVRFAAEKIRSSLSAQMGKAVADALEVVEPCELVEIPGAVEDRLVEYSEDVTGKVTNWMGVDDWTVEEGIHSLLSLMTIDGFILGNQERWEKYSARYTLLSRAFELDGEALRWHEPSSGRQKRQSGLGI